MKKNKLQHYIINITIILLIIYISCSLLFPSQMNKINPIKLHIVVTDSMDPVIPVDSLVIASNIDIDNLEKGDIIVFNTKGSNNYDVTMVHYFHDTHKDDEGNIRYQTYNEKSGLDNFSIERNDIIGKYNTHIPLVGKLLLFMKSWYGFFLIIQFILIYLIYRYLNKRMDKQTSK